MIDECESYAIPTETFLDMVANPFEDVIWKGAARPAILQNVLSYLKESDFELADHDSSLIYTVEWHERRIAYLSSLIQKGVKLAPCDIDIPFSCEGEAPLDAMVDGYHRLGAHIVANEPLLMVTPMGDIEAFERFLKRKRHERGALSIEP